MKKNVLIIDNDPIYRSLIQKLILKSNFSEKIFTANDGNESLNYLLKNQNNPGELPDVILLDIEMPVMNGWDFMDIYQSIKNSVAKKITVFLVSSSISPEDRQKALDYEDISGFYSKPITTEILSEIFK
ncbi:MAG: response regulator [Flavobacteriaceae bacterium]|jgi:CheY-like chemotaxis protein|nr:response regulator [Flavobacteriaceae bacterium]